MKKLTIRNDSLAAQAEEAARNNYKRLKNWSCEMPSDQIVKLGSMYSQPFRYGGTFKGWTGYRYLPRYTSYFEYENFENDDVQTRKIKYVFGFEGSIKTLKLIKPKNYEFHIDCLGLYLMAPDGTDWHLTAKDCLESVKGNKAFLGHVKQKIADKRFKIRETEKIKQKYENAIKTTFVNFEDARRAGNCVAGICSFVDKYQKLFKFSSQDMIKNPWLYQVPAKILKEVDASLTQNSIKQAILRETSVCI